MYKSIIYIKDGLHIGPLLGLNVVQYIKPLTNLKNAQGSPKSGLWRSAIATLRLYCRIKTDVKIIIQSRDLAGVSVTLCQRVTFLHLWHHCVARKGKTLLRRAVGCTPFLAHHGPKNSLRFSAHKVDSKKNRREQRTEKIASRNFCLPIFANKISKNREKSLDQKTHNIRFWRTLILCVLLWGDLLYFLLKLSFYLVSFYFRLEMKNLSMNSKWNNASINPQKLPRRENSWWLRGSKSRFPT